MNSTGSSEPVSGSRMEQVLQRTLPLLRALDEDATAVRPAPGKWSQRELLGHLIDSASNNHRRFVCAQFQEDLVFAGYAQEQWVGVQQYQSASWSSLIDLWYSFNVHLARVISAAPETERMRPRARHNLDQIAWQTVPADQPTTLAYFMNDYVDHLEHHLSQILGTDSE